MTHQMTVYVVDDDAGDRHHLAFRLGAMGIEAWPFAGAAAFLQNLDALRPQPLLISVDPAPHWSGELISRIRQEDIDWPMIVLSRSCDVELAVGAMKLGAVDFLLKPVDEERLLASVRAAAKSLEIRMEAREIRRAAEARVAALTVREITICKALLAGQPNKTIAHALDISIRTVEAHRGNIMMKLSVSNIAEALVLLLKAGLAPEPIALRPRRRLLLTDPHEYRSLTDAVSVAV